MQGKVVGCRRGNEGNQWGKAMRYPVATKSVAAGLCVLLLGIGGSTGLRADDASDKAGIQSLWTTYASAAVSGDTETWLSLWDPAGVQMPPGVPARGIDVVAANIADAWAKRPPRKSMNINPIDIEIAGDWAFARGDYDVTSVIGGAEKKMEGKFLTILKRQDDGSFKIYRDCFNGNGE